MLSLPHLEKIGPYKYIMKFKQELEDDLIDAIEELLCYIFQGMCWVCYQPEERTVYVSRRIRHVPKAFLKSPISRIEVKRGKLIPAMVERRPMR